MEHANNSYNIKSQNFYFSEGKSEQNKESSPSYAFNLNMSSGNSNIRFVKNIGADSHNSALDISKEKLPQHETIGQILSQDTKKYNFSFNKILYNPNYNNTIKSNYNYYII